MPVRTQWTYYGRITCQENIASASVEIIGTAVDWRPHRDMAMPQPEPTRMTFRASAPNNAAPLVFTRDAPDSEWKLQANLSPATDSTQTAVNAWLEHAYPAFSDETLAKMAEMSESFLKPGWTDGSLEAYCESQQLASSHRDTVICVPQVVGVDGADTSSTTVRRIVHLTLGLSVLGAAILIWKREIKRHADAD